MSGRWYGWVRQVTGIGYRHYCYLVREHEVVERACQRNHRTAATAQACADRAARRRNRRMGAA